MPSDTSSPLSSGALRQRRLAEKPREAGGKRFSCWLAYDADHCLDALVAKGFGTNLEQAVVSAIQEALERQI